MSQDHLPIARPALLIAGILLIAATLRAPIVGIAPLLGMIRASFSLGAAEAGALTTLPLLAFAAGSPFVVLVARRYGLERSLFGALLLVAVGILLRSLGLVSFLFLGTGIIGVGVAVANVLLPSLLKRDFPEQVAALTGAYALPAGGGAALASVVAVPLAGLPGMGWSGALGAFVLMPVVAMAVWLPQLGRHATPVQATTLVQKNEAVWRSPLAWQVTLFFGLNALVYYVIVAWLPTILAQAGYLPAVAGSLHGVLQIATAIPGLVFGAIVKRLKDQKVLAVIQVGLTAISLAGLLWLPQWATLWAVFFGLGTGMAFILGLAFIGLRAASAHQAASLSGMVQCVGYLVAATAPAVAGFIHDQSDGWKVPLLLLLVLCGVMATFGYRAGRPLHIGEESGAR